MARLLARRSLKKLWESPDETGWELKLTKGKIYLGKDPAGISTYRGVRVKSREMSRKPCKPGLNSWMRYQMGEGTEEGTIRGVG